MSVQSAPNLSRHMSRQSESNYAHASSNRRQTVPSIKCDSTFVGSQSPHHIAGEILDPREYLLGAGVIDSNFAAQSFYPTGATFDQNLGADLLSTPSSRLTYSPTSTASLNSPHYSTDQTDPMSFMSADMSRDSSFASSFPLNDHLAMLHVKSEAPCMSSSNSQNHHSVPFGAEINHPHPHPHPHQLVAGQHSPSTNHFDIHLSSHKSSSDEFNFTIATQAGNAFAAPPMHRQSSASSSRSYKRHLETIQQSERRIAPALNQHSVSSVKTEDNQRQLKGGEQMVRMVSDNGEEKLYGVLSKSAERQKRASAPKLVCPHCNDHPYGFRGDHELQRHVNRAHAKMRKVWVCVDASSDGKFLANCKACRTKKRYHAYYNAAAHLRRTHFNPRKKGRRSKGEEHEKRGGKGGGDWPPMPDLKENWMKEIMEVVTDDVAELSDEQEADVDDLLEHNEPDSLVSNDYTPVAPLDETTVGYIGTSFNNTPPMPEYYPPSFDDGAMFNAMPLHAADMMPYCETEPAPQAQSMFPPTDMYYDPNQGFLSQQAPAFDPTVLAV